MVPLPRGPIPSFTCLPYALGDLVISPPERDFSPTPSAVQPCYLFLLLTFLLFSDSELILVLFLLKSSQTSVSLAFSTSPRYSLPLPLPLLPLLPVALADLTLLGSSHFPLSSRSLFVGHVSTCFQPPTNPPEHRKRQMRSDLVGRGREGKFCP